MEQTPFWVAKAADADPSEVAGLKRMPTDHNTNDILNAIPVFTEVENDLICGGYGEKDGLLVYHFYHRQRKEVIDSTYQRMEEAKNLKDPRKSAVEQERLALEGNARLQQIPWYPEFEQKLETVIKEVFRYRPYKIGFHPEVDSYSVIMPTGTTPLPPTREQLEQPFELLAKAVS